MTLVDVAINVLAIALIGWALIWLVDQLGLPHPARMIAVGLIVLLLIGWVFRYDGGWRGTRRGDRIA